MGDGFRRLSLREELILEVRELIDDTWCARSVASFIDKATRIHIEKVREEHRKKHAEMVARRKKWEQKRRQR